MVAQIQEFDAKRVLIWFSDSESANEMSECGCSMEVVAVGYVLGKNNIWRSSNAEAALAG